MSITINGNGTVTGISVGGLPDGIVDNDMIANTTIAEGKLAANVNTITVVDQWQQTADSSVSSSQVLTANWGRTASTATGAYQTFGRIDTTGMTESSGVFTFPSTGVWRIEFTGSAYKSDYPRRWMGAHLLVTKDNSTYTDTAYVYQSTWSEDGSSVYAASTVVTIFDVTSTSDCKVKFKVSCDGAMTWMGDDSNAIPYTHAIFTRLGDT